MAASSISTDIDRHVVAIGCPSPLKATTDSLLSVRAALHALASMTWPSQLPANPPRRCTKVAGALLAGRYHTFAHHPWSDALRDSLNR